MATKTRAAEPAPASSAELQTHRTEIAARQRRRKEELEQCRRADRRGMNEEQLAELARRRGLLEELLEQDGQELADAERDLASAQVREAAEAAVRDAAAAQDGLIDRLLLKAENSAAAAAADARDLQRAVGRLFDREVRSLLKSDPTEGRRGRILRLCSNDSRLSELERDGRSLVEVAASERWPKLVHSADGGVRYDHLDRIQTAEQYRDWLRLGHQPVPGGSQAARQRTELRERFDVRFGR